MVASRSAGSARERRLRAAADAHSRQPMQPDHFDERTDVRLRMREPEHLTLGPQPLREAREIDHQRRVGEPEAGEIHDHVAGRVQGRG